MDESALREERSELEREKVLRAKAEETLSSMKLFLFDYFHQLGPDPLSNIDVIVQALGKALHVTVALYNRMESGVLKTWSIDHAPPGYCREDRPEGHICYEMTIKKRDANNLRPVMLSDVEIAHWEQLDANVRNYNLKSYLAFPVLLENAVVGSLCVVDVNPREYTQVEIDIMEAFSKAVTLEEERRLSQHKLAEANEALSNKNEQIERIALTDFLTGLPNRRAIRETFAKATASFKRGCCQKERAETKVQDDPKGFAIVLGDIDHFKNVNDTYGHSCGDQVLVDVAKILQSSLRGQDSVARWGGEEFIMLLPDTNLAGGRIIAERIRKRIANAMFAYEGHAVSITMTFGVSTYDDAADDFDTRIAKADAAMYQGKNGGRNQVVTTE